MNLRLRNLAILAAVAVGSSLALWLGVGGEKIYENFDGPYYVVVAQTWYNKVDIGKNFSFPVPLEYYPAHLPLYPLLIKAVSLAGITPLKAMVLINVLAAVGGAWAMYLVWDKMRWGNPLGAGLVWLFMWPRMWVVRSVGSPETLFVLWIVLSLYWFNKQKYWLAAAAGAVAVVTKSPGILLLVGYGMWGLGEWIKTKKFPVKAYPVILIGLAMAGVFYFYQVRTGDFWAYFHSGDNIHLQAMPFKVFDSSQPWVGSWWLEDVLWIYIVGGIGVYRAWKKNRVWGWFGAVYLASIFFVSHRDIGRYSLPIVPVVILGLCELWEKKEVRWGLALLLIPMFFYSINFLNHNLIGIANWQPFLQMFSK